MSRRPLIIVLLLFASLGLIGVLGWQSWQLQQTNDAAARAVQRDYANLAADELGRRMTAALGYRGYFQVISRLDDPADAEAIRAVLDSDEQLADAAKLVDAAFVANATELSIDEHPRSSDLRDLIMSIASADAELDGPYKSVSATKTTPQLIYSRRSADNRLFGFSVASDGVTEYLQAALDAGPLLPASLAEGKVGNAQLYVEIRDAADKILLVSNSPFEYPQLVEKVMGNDYQGVVEGFRIRIAVDPSFAGNLVIGGLPAEQLPLLLVVMLLAIALLLAAIWLFRREHALMRLRVDFVAQVSHELRTPLTQIRMFAETLLLKRTRSEAEQQRALEIIDRESRRLSHLVENILQFSNISDSLRVQPELQPVMPVVREVCAAMQLMNRTTRIEVSGAEAAQASVDDDALRQILLNLLDNAIKYGPEAQLVRVVVTEVEAAAQIAVIDQGPGIPKAEQVHVWQAFYRQEKEQKTAISGTGIGLAVVRDLAEAMQGSCWFAQCDTGTHVIVQLPNRPGND